MKLRDISKIDKAILHCAETPINKSFDVEDVRKWHTDPKPKGNGWSEIAYHYYIKLDGTLQKGRDLWLVGAHAYGENDDSIGICLEGGLNADGTPWTICTERQRETLKQLLIVLGVSIHGLQLHGHYEFSDTKTCPNFKIEDLNFW